MKPENILLDNKEELSIKLSDFGFATYFKPSEKESRTVGTPFYMAPEIIKSQPYDERVDIWSAGVIVYYLLSGDLPFMSANKD